MADDPHALSSEDVAHFIERGFVWVRECFSPSFAAEAVRATLVDRSPPPRLTYATDARIEDFDLTDPSTWGGRPGLTIETGRRFVIASLAPRLWSAMSRLVGEGRELERRAMGEQWILNGPFEDPPAPALTPDYYRDFSWHIDLTSERATLADRRDALVILILWSDVERGGAGTLYSPASLDHVVRALEAHPEGFDTTGPEWAREIVASCGDVREVTGRAGDALITHPFLLHSAQRNFSKRIRVLENPTITVAAPLDYGYGASRPERETSPVEEVVLRRLRHRPPRPSRRRATVATLSPPCQVEPSSPPRPKRATPRAISIHPVPEWMSTLVQWAEDPASSSAATSGSPPRVAAWYAAGRVFLRSTGGPTGSLVELTLDGGGSVEAHRVDVSRKPATRHRLGLASLGPEARVGVERFVRRFTWMHEKREAAARAYRADPVEAYALELVRSFVALSSMEDAASVPLDREWSAPMLEAAHMVLDLLAGRYERVFAAIDRGYRGPAWLAPVLTGLSGDVVALTALAEASASPSGVLSLIEAFGFSRAGFHRAALGPYRAAIEHLFGAEQADFCVGLARVYGAEGYVDESVDWARRAILLRSQDDELLVRACRELVRHGRFDDAFAALSHRAASGSASPETMRALAELLIWAGRGEEARPWLDRAKRAIPDPRQDPALEGALRAIEGEWAIAERHFRQLLELDPRHGAALTWMAEVALRRGAIEEARALLGESRARAQTPVHTVIDAALTDRWHPDHRPDLLALLDAMEVPRDEWVDATERPHEAALRVLERFGGNRGTPTCRRVEPSSPSEVGLRLVRVPEADESLTSRDASAELLKRLGAWSLSEIEQAFDALAERFSSSPHPLCYRGELDLWLGHYERAIERFRAALARDHARWGYVGQAAAFILLGEHDRAQEVLATCDLVYEPVLGATTLVYVGESLRRRGEHHAAIEALAEAVRVKPGRVGAWMNLALAHHAVGEPERASQIYQQLAARVPRLYWDAWRALGHRPAWPIDPDHMPALFEKALEMMRGNRSSHLHTYFDVDGRFKIARDGEGWRRELAHQARFVGVGLAGQLASGLEQV